MKFDFEEIFEFGRELGIATSDYQNQAAGVYSAFEHLLNLGNGDQKKNAVSFRLQKNPPALQLIKKPVETKKAAIVTAKIEILTEENLHREVLLLTPEDMTLVRLHFHNMLPEEIWELSQKIKQKHPDTWLVLQRFSFHEEGKTDLPFSFNPVKASDGKTWEYLKNLPLELLSL